jgi:hypothetical protein
MQMDKTILVLLGLLAAVGAAVFLLLPGATPGPSSPGAAAPGAPVVRTSSALPSVDGIVRANEYGAKAEIGGVEVSWSTERNALRVGIVSPGTGWVAIGLDPTTMMDKANIILGAVVNNSIVARDDVGTGPFSHAPDTSVGGADNLLAAAGREADGKTVFEFAIPLNSGDSADRPLSVGQTVKVIVAYQTTSDDFGERHSRRTSGEIVLAAP